MTTTTLQVRDLAYQLWQTQGCPAGRDQEHWFEAERLLNETHSHSVPKPAAPRKKPASKRKART